MRKVWLDPAWEDYLFWQAESKKILRKINRLIQEIERKGYNGLGKPEPMKGNLSGWWSVRIDDKNRIVFKIEGQGEGQSLVIAQCGSHYRDK
jgi:toxin YoeB